MSTQEAIVTCVCTVSTFAFLAFIIYTGTKYP